MNLPFAPFGVHQARASKRAIIIALLLGSLLASLDQSAVSTALPTIASELGGVQYTPWLVTAYLLAATVVTPICGRLGDLLGRKLVLQISILLFLCGSASCASAHSIFALIGFRVIQGAGAGALVVTVVATVAELFPPLARARYQGLLGATLTASTIVGPPVGGYLVDHFTWRWIFYLNLPLALAVLGVVSTVLKSPPRPPHMPAIDYAGAFFLTSFLGTAVFAATFVPTIDSWPSPPTFAVGFVCFASLVALWIAEVRAADPLFPPSMFANRTMRTSSLVGFIVGFGLFGSAIYLPLYFQLVMGLSPSASGFAVVPMVASTLVASTFSGLRIGRTGRYRFYPIAGTAIAGLATAFLATIDSQTSLATVIIETVGIGFGIGLVTQVLILAVQNAVPYEQLGIATSTTSMFRAMGALMGASVFGAILTVRLHSLASTAGAINTHGDGSGLGGFKALSEIPHDVAWTREVAGGLHLVFGIAAALTGVAFLIAWQLRDTPAVSQAVNRSGN